MRAARASLFGALQQKQSVGRNSHSHMSGRIEALWIKRAHRGVMDSVQSASLVAGQGIVGNVDRSRRRQVTLVEAESWAACMEELRAAKYPVGRRANILVSGVPLARTRGRILMIGQVTLAIGGELTPCERMEDVTPGLQAALRSDWRGGVFAQVLTGGLICVGDPVHWQESGPPAGINAQSA